jgi:hypothetical protein
MADFPSAGGTNDPSTAALVKAFSAGAAGAARGIGALLGEANTGRLKAGAAAAAAGLGGLSEQAAQVFTLMGTSQSLA